MIALGDRLKNGERKNQILQSLLFSALQHPRNFSVQFGTVRFVNRPF